MLWVNFKIYKESFGEGALKLAEICEQVSQKTKTKIIPVVSAFDLSRIKKIFSGEVWVQHLDFHFEGANTGRLSPLAAIALGAGGTLLNHSEHKLKPTQIRQTLSYLKRKKWIEHWQKEINGIGNWKLKIENFKTMICFRSNNQVKKWLTKLDPRPDFLAYEPSELIGGKVSVSQAQPEMIKNIVKLLADHNLVVGAGIHQASDIQKALSLGAKGVLVSSDVIKAKDPKSELLELALAFKN